MNESKLKKANSLKRKAKKCRETIQGLKHLKNHPMIISMYSDLPDVMDDLIKVEENELGKTERQFKRL